MTQKTIIRPANLKQKPRVSGFVPATEPIRKTPFDPGPGEPHTINNAGVGGKQQQVQSNPVEQPTTQFVNDGRYALLSDLPTGYKYYDFKELWIRPFTPNEARLLHMAKISGNLTYIISAVSACLSQSISKIIIEDFEFCLYWLRLNSYPNRPFSVTWNCDLQKTDLETGELIVGDYCSKENVSIINKTNLIIESLDNDFVLPEGLAYPTIAIFEEIWDLRKRLEVLDEEEPDFETQRDEILGDIYLMNLAQWIESGKSANDKLNILKDSADLGFQEQLEDKINVLPQFGVSESLEVHCEECGGTTKRRLSLDYLTFFP